MTFGLVLALVSLAGLVVGGGLHLFYPSLLRTPQAVPVSPDRGAVFEGDGGHISLKDSAIRGFHRVVRGNNVTFKGDGLEITSDTALNLPAPSGEFEQLSLPDLAAIVKSEAASLRALQAKYSKRSGALRGPNSNVSAERAFQAIVAVGNAQNAEFKGRHLSRDLSLASELVKRAGGQIMLPADNAESANGRACLREGKLFGMGAESVAKFLEFFLSAAEAHH